MINRKSKSVEWMKLVADILFLGAGFGWELWYTTRKNGQKQYHFIQCGYVIMENEDNRFILFTLTILWFSFKLGWRTY